MNISYSQVNSFATCGEQFRLERIVHAPSIPSWPAIAGNAFHTVTEVDDYRRNGQEPPEELRAIFNFNDALDYHIALAQERSPEFPKAEWHVGGRKSVANPNKEDETWWRANGEGMRTKYSNFVSVVPWDIYDDPTHGLGIELGVSYETNDGDTMRGFIDRVYQDRASGRLIVVDLKTGQEPKSPRQLGFYKNAIARGIPDYPPINLGTFYMSRTGTTTEVVDLTAHTPERLDYQSNALHKAVEAGIFIANPGSLCGVCSVRNSCYEMHPESTPEVFLPWPTVKSS